MKKLPVGISGLEKIITGDYVYIDKTRHIFNLVDSGGVYYFLSRPRRFGKSLFIDTLKQAFLGNKELFKGLYLEHHWDWDTKYPVIHLDFGSSSRFLSQERFFTEVKNILDHHAEHYGVELSQVDYGARFEELLHKLHAKYNSKVVVLVDEYDKPILDKIDDQAGAFEMRDILKGLYSYIKKNDFYLKFVLLTGVSKFSKISLFSDLNILDDITLASSYADICGYNQAELEHYFKKYLDLGAVEQVLLKKWYNGYNFAGNEQQKVYNPFDILLFINKGYKYHNYWFETGTPTFLVKLIEKNQYFTPNLEDLVVSSDLLSTFDVDTMPVATLLFQTGYLTIKAATTIGTQMAYYLTYPNLEVKASLNGTLASIASKLDDKDQNLNAIAKALNDNRFDDLLKIFTAHFAAIPNDWYRNNHIDNYEGFYASIVYSYLAALGYDLIAEDVTNQGSIDLTIKMPGKILIIEFKLAKYGNASAAIAQIKERNYMQKYLADNQPLYLIGISFDSVNRNVTDLRYEKYN